MKILYKFDHDWFKRQFGKRPDPRTSCEISQELDELDYKLSRLKERAFHLQLWTAEENAALKSFKKTVSDLRRKQRRKKI